MTHGGAHAIGAGIAAANDDHILARSEDRADTVVTEDGLGVGGQAHENHPACTPINPNEPDAFWRDLEHNYVNRNVLAIFRGNNANI